MEHSSAEKAPAAARISADQEMAVSFQQRELGTVGSAVWVNDHANCSFMSIGDEGKGVGNSCVNFRITMKLGDEYDV